MLKNRLSLVFVLLGLCFAVEAASSSNVGYRRIEIQDTVIGETFPVAICIRPVRSRAILCLAL